MTEHMSLAEYKKIIGLETTEQPKTNKYNNQKTNVDGITFDSKLEAKRYKELKMLKEAGEIIGFGLQPSFVVGLKTRYIPDFIVCGKDGKIWCEDVKSVGTATAVFKVKHNLWKEKYPWIPLRLIGLEK